ncbi:MAG: tetratricopeptide repeat protein [Planctomycetota bacterium]
MADRLEQLLKLHAADPDDADVPYMIALEHAKADDPAEAIAWLDRALALDPGYHYAYFQKAKMLSELGEDEDARAVLDQGIARASADGHAKAVGELEELKLSMG